MPASPDHNSASDSDFDEKALAALEEMDTESEAPSSDEEDTADIEIRLAGAKGSLAPSSYRVMETPKPMPIEADDESTLAKDVSKAQPESFGCVLDSEENKIWRTVVYATNDGIVHAVIKDQAMALSVALKLKKGAKSALKVADAKKVLSRSKRAGKPWTSDDFEENGHPLFCFLAATAKTEARKKIAKQPETKTAETKPADAEKKKSGKPDQPPKESPAPKRPATEEEAPKPKRARKRVEPAHVEPKPKAEADAGFTDIRTLSAQADNAVWEFVDAAIQAYRDSSKAEGGVIF